MQKGTLSHFGLQKKTDTDPECNIKAIIIKWHDKTQHKLYNGSFIAFNRVWLCVVCRIVHTLTGTESILWYTNNHKSKGHTEDPHGTATGGELYM